MTNYSLTAKIIKRLEAMGVPDVTIADSTIYSSGVAIGSTVGVITKERLEKIAADYKASHG